RPGDAGGEESSDDRDPDVGQRQPLRAVRVEEDRVGGDQEQALAEPERDRLAGEERDHLPHVRLRHSGDDPSSAACSALARSRPASAAITPLASSGRSASSSSSTTLLTRRSRVGSSAVTEATRGSGTSTASSPTEDPGPSSTSVRSPRWTRTRPLTTTYRQSSTAPSS